MIIEEQHRLHSTITKQPAQIVPAAEWSAAQLDPRSSPALQRALPGLIAAFDEPLMLASLQAALFDPDQSGSTITHCEIDQSTYLPDPGCIIRYLLTLRDAQGTERQVLVSGRLFADQRDCEAYVHEQLMPLVGRLAEREEVAAFARPVAMLRALQMAVHAFPLDADVPELIDVSDRRVVAALLNDVLRQEQGLDFAVADCRTELVDYGRQRRATLRYYVTSKASDSAAAQQVLVYGKLTGDGSGALAGAISDALRERVNAPGSAYHFNVPRVLAWRPELHLSLLEAIPGQGLIADTLKALLRDKPYAGGALSLEEMLDACARIAATLHTSGIQIGRPRVFDDMLASLRREMVQLDPISPALGAQLNGALDRIAAAAAQCAPLPLCFNHGDFTYGQMLFDGTHSGLVDFDSVCQAEPALDLAQFLTYLRVSSLKSKLSPVATRALVDRLTEGFLHTYVASAAHQTGELEQLLPRIAVYKALSLARRTLRSWQKFKPSRIESALVLLEEEISGFAPAQ